jgi:small-conductance mechanosensitive channel
MFDALSGFFVWLWEQLVSGFQHLHEQRQLRYVITAVIVTVAYLVLVRLVRRLLPGLARRIAADKDRRIHALKLQNQQILSSEEIAGILTGLVNGIRLPLLFVMTLLYLQILLGLFPPTRGPATHFLNQAVDALQRGGQALLAFLPNLLIIVIIVFATHYLIRLIGLVFRGISTGRIRFSSFYPAWGRPTFNIVRFLVIVFALVLIFPYLPGSGSDAFKGISIFFGLLVSMGSTAAVANVVAGIVIIYMRAFDLGDRVQIGNTTGDVIQRGLLVTKIRTIKRVEVTIPNATLLGSEIINYSASRGQGILLPTTVTIGYDVPWRDVHDLLIDAAREDERISEEPAPFVLQTALDDFYVRYELNVHTKYPSQGASILSALHQSIQDRFSSAGVEIMSPHYRAVRDGNQAAVPSPPVDDGEEDDAA